MFCVHRVYHADAGASECPAVTGGRAGLRASGGRTTGGRTTGAGATGRTTGAGATGAPHTHAGLGIGTIVLIHPHVHGNNRKNNGAQSVRGGFEPRPHVYAWPGEGAMRWPGRPPHLVRGQRLYDEGPDSLCSSLPYRRAAARRARRSRRARPGRKVEAATGTADPQAAKRGMAERASDIARARFGTDAVMTGRSLRRKGGKNTAKPLPPESQSGQAARQRGTRAEARAARQRHSDAGCVRRAADAANAARARRAGAAP